MSNELERFGAELPVELTRRVRVLAANEGKTLKELLQEALEDLLDKRQKQQDEPALEFALA